jgi:hypothetical protein
MFPAHLKDAFSSVFSDGPPPSSLPPPDFFRPMDGMGVGGGMGDPFGSSSFGGFGGPPPGVPPPGFGAFPFPPPPQAPSYPNPPGSASSHSQSLGGPPQQSPFPPTVPSYFGQQSNPSADAAVAALKALLPGVPVAFDEQNQQQSQQRQSNNLFAAFDY